MLGCLKSSCCIGSLEYQVSAPAGPFSDLDHWSLVLVAPHNWDGKKIAVNINLIANINPMKSHGDGTSVGADEIGGGHELSLKRSKTA